MSNQRILESAMVLFKGDYSDLQKKAQQAAREIKGFGDKSAQEANRAKSVFTEVGNSLRSMAGKIAALGVGAMIFKLAEDFDAANKKIRSSTGETGTSLKGLQNDMKAVFVNRGGSADDASTAIITLHQRTGLAGKSLQDLAIQSMRLAKITGADLAGSIALTTRVMGDWGNGGDKAASTLDYLFRVTQKTGVNITRLSEAVVYFGAPMRQMGFDFETAAALIGKFEKEGVNVETVLTSLRRALSNLSKQGISAPEGFAQIVKEIKEAKTPVEATTKAMAVFGVKGGSDMSAAIREGRFEIADLMKQLRESPETLAKASRESETFGSAIGKIRNAIIAALDPLGASMVKALDDITPRLKEGAQQFAAVIKGLAGIPAPAVQAAEGIAAIALLSGPIGKTVAAIKLIPGALVFLHANTAVAISDTMALTTAITGMNIGVKAAMGLLGGLALAAGWATTQIGEAINAFLEWQRVKAENDQLAADTEGKANELISKGQDAYFKWQKGATLGAKDLKAALVGMRLELQNVDKSSPDYNKIKGDIDKMQAELNRRFGVKHTSGSTTGGGGTGGKVDLGGLFDKGGKTEDPNQKAIQAAQERLRIANLEADVYGKGDKAKKTALASYIADLKKIPGAYGLILQAMLDQKRLQEEINEKTKKGKEDAEKFEKTILDRPADDMAELVKQSNEELDEQLVQLEERRGTFQDENTYLEAQKSLYAEQLQYLIDINAPLDEQRKIREQIAKLQNKSTDSDKESIDWGNVGMQGLQAGAGLAETAIRDGGVSAGDVSRAGGGLAGTVIGGILGGPVGAAIGSQIGNAAGGVIGAWFDQKDSEAAEKQLKAAETQKQAAESAAKWADTFKQWKDFGGSFTDALASAKIDLLEATGAITPEEADRRRQDLESGGIVDKAKGDATKMLEDQGFSGAESSVNSTADWLNGLYNKGYKSVEDLASAGIELGDWQKGIFNAIVLANTKKDTFNAKQIADSLKEALSSFTSGNPIQVHDEGLRNLFAVMPTQRYMVESAGRMDINLRIDGKVDKAAIMGLQHDPDVKGMFAKMANSGNAAMQLVPAQ